MKKRKGVEGEMKMKQLRMLLIYVGIGCVALAILWLMLMGSALIPNRAIQSNMEQSALEYAAREPFEITNGKHWNSVADHYADTILLNVAWNMGSDNVIRSSLDTKYYDGEDLGEHYGLYLSITEGKTPNTDYSRYWHGSSMFVRLFHLFTDVNGLKWTGFIVLLLLIVGTVGWLVFYRHVDLAVLLVLSLVSVQFWNVRLSLEYQPCFLLAFALSLLFLATEKKNDTWLIGLSILGGVSVCFFDFLTTETLVILLPLILVTAVRAKEHRLGGFRQNLFLYLKCVGAWGIAYIGTFLSKWIFACAVTGKNVFIDALSSAAQRIGGEVGAENMAPKSIFSSITANFSMIFGAQSRVEYAKTWIVILVCLVLLGSVWYLFRNQNGNGTAGALLLLLGVAVLVRYLLLNNHSYLHNFFTYRALLSTIFAVLLAIWFNIRLPQKKRGRK